MYHLGLFTKNLVETIVKYYTTYICRNFIWTLTHTQTHSHIWYSIAHILYIAYGERMKQHTPCLSHTLMEKATTETTTNLK